MAEQGRKRGVGKKGRDKEKRGWREEEERERRDIGRGEKVSEEGSPFLVLPNPWRAGRTNLSR